MKRFKKPAVAQNPVSQNIAARLGYYKYGDAAFKVKLEDIEAKIKTKYGDGLSQQTILSWIAARRDDPEKSMRNPQIDSLKLLVDILEDIDNPYDLFVDQQKWIAKNKALDQIENHGLLPDQEEIIDKIKLITDSKSLRIIKGLVDINLQELNRGQSLLEQSLPSSSKDESLPKRKDQ